MADISKEQIEQILETLRSGSIKLNKDQRAMFKELQKAYQNNVDVQDHANLAVKGYANSLAAAIEQHKKNMRLSLEEAETREEAMAVLGKQMRQQGLLGEILGKNSHEFEQSGKRTNLLSREFDRLGDAAKGLSRGGMMQILESIGIKQAAVFAMVAAEMDKSLDTWRDFRNSGMLLDESIMTLRDASAKSGMSFDTFAESMGSAGENAKKFGIETLGEVTKEARSAMVSVGNLGMTTKMTAEALSDYMEIESIRTTFSEMQDKSNRQMTATRFQGFVKDMDSFSKALGVSRKDLMASFKNLMTDTEFTNVLKTMGKVAGDKLGMNLAAISQVSGPLGEQMMTMTKNAKIFGSAIREGGSAVLEGFAPGFAAFVQDMENMSPAQVAEGMARFGKMVQGNTTQLAAMARNGDEGAKMLLEMSANAEKYISTAERMRQIDEDQSKGIGLFMKNLEQVGEKFGAIFTGLGNIVGKIVAPLFTGLGYIIEPIISGLEIISNGINNLSDWLDTVPDMAKVIMLAAGAGLTFLMKKAFTDLISHISMLKSIAGSSLEFGKKMVPDFVKKGASGIADRIGSAREAISNIGTLGTLRNPMFVIIAGEKKELFEGMRERDRRERRRGRNVPTVGSDDLRTSSSSSESTSKKGKLLGTLGKVGGKMSGLGGIAMAAGGMALDQIGDFKGKDTISGMMTYGGMGAQIGMMFGPLGALIGGGAGAALGVVIENWDSITDGIGSMVDGITDWFSGIPSFFGDMFQGAKDLFFKYHPLGILIENWDSVKDGISGIFTGIGDWFTGIFTWISSLDWKSAVRFVLGGPNTMAGQLFDKFAGTSQTTPTTNAFNPPSIATPATIKPEEIAQPQSDNKVIVDKLNELNETNKMQVAAIVGTSREQIEATKSRSNQPYVAVGTVS